MLNADPRGFLDFFFMDPKIPLQTFLNIEAIQTMFTRMIQGYCAYDAKTGSTFHTVPFLSIQSSSFQASSLVNHKLLIPQGAPTWIPHSPGFLSWWITT